MSLKHSISFARLRKIYSRQVALPATLTRHSFHASPAYVSTISPTVGARCACARDAKHDPHNSLDPHKSMQKSPAQVSCFQYLPHSFRAIRISLNPNDISLF
jgi:hypothetical protein